MEEAQNQNIMALSELNLGVISIPKMFLSIKERKEAEPSVGPNIKGT